MSFRLAKLAPWLLCAVLALLIATHLSTLAEKRRQNERPRFVAIPHTVSLDKTAHKEMATVDLPELAGMTVDDLVRGLLHLGGELPPKVETELRLTTEQAKALQPHVHDMRMVHEKLRSWRQARHEMNEASMEDALAVGEILTNEQLDWVLNARQGTRPMNTRKWQKVGKAIDMSLPYIHIGDR